MGYNYDKELIDWFDFRNAWREWAQQRPSLKHPIKYFKWYFSEPKYKKGN